MIRWWRRNWWGLLAVLPVFVAILAIHPNQPYQTWRGAQPRTAVTAGADGWVEYGGARLQLAGLEPAVLEDFFGDPYPVPAGVRAWRATVTIAPASNPDALLGCTFLLEDFQGRRFSSDPQLLRGARLSGDDSLVAGRCTPGPDADDGPLASFDTTILFALPAEAEPRAIWVTLLEERPAYARLAVGAVGT